MNSNREIDKLIWAFIDGTDSVEVRELVEQRVEVDPVFKQRYDLLKRLDYSLRKVDMEEPSMRFSANVMDQVKMINKKFVKALTFSRSSKWYLLSMTASLGAVVGFPFAYPGAVLAYSNSITILSDLPQGGSKSLIFITAICLCFLLVFDRILKRYYKSSLTKPI